MTDLEKFLKAYASGEHAARIIEIDVPEVSNDGPDSPFIVLRWGRYAAVVNPQGLADHLSIDVHPFVDGKDARAGVFGMDQDVSGQVGFPAGLAGTSHGWPATAMAVILVGKQEGRPVPPSNSSRREDDLLKWDVNGALFGDHPNIGDQVYIDLGDSVGTGGEVTGVLQELSAAGVRIVDGGDHGQARLIPWTRIVFMERR